MLPSNQEISMEVAKESLKVLNKHMLKQSDEIYIFGAYLSEKLPIALSPLGFYSFVESNFRDLELGMDSLTRQPIDNALVKKPREFYDSLRTKIPKIVYAVCPGGFGEDVEYLYKQRSMNIQGNKDLEFFMKRD